MPFHDVALLCWLIVLLIIFRYCYSSETKAAASRDAAAATAEKKKHKTELVRSKHGNDQSPQEESPPRTIDGGAVVFYLSIKNLQTIKTFNDANRNRQTAHVTQALMTIAFLCRLFCCFYSIDNVFLALVELMPPLRSCVVASLSQLSPINLPLSRCAIKR